MHEPPLDVSVILPTYNEAENLPVIVPQICSVLQADGLRGEVIVVDDNSPDGTAAVGERLAAEHPVRVLLRTEERGLATAVRAGFRLSRAEVCVVMDADGSHPVERLPEMIQPLLRGEADIAVGSRNVKGGSIGEWPWYRRLTSKGAALLAAGLSKMSDPTSGFMAIRRCLLEGVELNPIGWKIVLETVVKVGSRRLIEVPITFTDRVLGQSKMSLREQSNYLRHLYRLYKFKFPGLIQFIKFCLVGFSGVFVDMGVVAGLKELFELDTRLCAVPAYLLAVTTNYLLNRYWTFELRSRARFLSSYLAFVAVCSAGLAVRLGFMHVLIEYTVLGARKWYLLVNFLGIVVATVVNFSGSKWFAFSSRLVKPHEPPRGGHRSS